jgi:hypothetical protein
MSRFAFYLMGRNQSLISAILSIKISVIAFSRLYTDDSAVPAVVPRNRDMFDKKHRGGQNAPAYAGSMYSLTRSGEIIGAVL